MRLKPNPSQKIQLVFSIDIHLDMKPKQVLLTNRWSTEELLSDFGKCATADVIVMF